MPVGEIKRGAEYRAFTQDKSGPARIIGAGLDISESCNLACPGCYRPNSEGKNGYMLPQTASLITKKLIGYGASEIYNLGAEPTLNPELPKILRDEVDLGFKFVLLISNGMRFADENYARQVLIPGVSILMQRHTLGEDSLAQKIQEESVGKQGTLEESHRAWENVVKIFNEKGGDDKLMMQCCLTEAAMSGDNLDKLFRWARENLGTLPIMEYEAPPHRGFNDQLEWLGSYPPLTKKVVTQLERFMKIDEIMGIPVATYKDAVSPQAYNTSCTMLKEGGQITNGGVYLPCTNMNPDSTHPLQYGNVILQPFEKIEKNPVRRAFVEPNFKVKGCSDPCQGSGCWWTGLVTTGCYRLCQLNCVFNEGKQTIDDIPELCNDCRLNELRKEGVLNCGPGTRPGLALGEAEKTIFRME